MKEDVNLCDAVKILLSKRRWHHWLTFDGQTRTRAVRWRRIQSRRDHRGFKKGVLKEPAGGGLVLQDAPFFFDFEDEDQIWPDDIGLEFPTLGDAITSALKGLGGMAHDAPPHAYRIRVTVRDEENDLARLELTCAVELLKVPG